MIFLGTPQLRGGVHIFFFYKVSFVKHSSVGSCGVQSSDYEADFCRARSQGCHGKGDGLVWGSSSSSMATMTMTMVI